MLNSTHANITKYSGFILSPFGSVAHLLRQRQLSLRPIDAAAAKDCGKLMYAALVPWPAALSRRRRGYSRKFQRELNNYVAPFVPE